MKLTQFFWRTYKEVPSEAQIPSHKLLLKSGMIQKSGAGLYSYLPMGLIVIKKIESIVREELSTIGASELLMNFVTPSGPWKKSGRWQSMGSEMQRFSDQKDNEYCLSPTNEESITDIFLKSVNSYKQLPVSLFQIGTKYRNEVRPRFGLMRAKEFIMKDAYTFSLNQKCLDNEYEKYYQAYETILKRIGLNYIVVEADGGNISENNSKTHEFQVIATTGEDIIIHADETGYAANIEKAQTFRKDASSSEDDTKEAFDIETIGLKTCSEVSAFLNLSIESTLKTLVYRAFSNNEDLNKKSSSKENKEQEYLMVVLYGDDDLNEFKLANYLNSDVQIATESEIESLGLIKGFIGPSNKSNLRIIFDDAIDTKQSYVVGANKKDFHTRGFLPARDLSNIEVVSLRLSKEGDLSPDKSTPVSSSRGIEVAHIFQLGDKYTKSMEVFVLNDKGKKAAPLMGCYGIGISRIMAAAVEQSHDEKGIIWPFSIAPFHVYIAALGKSEDFKKSVEDLYLSLKEDNFEVCYDDRGLGLGAMLKDAELVGVPFIVFIGERDYKGTGEFELIIRKNGKRIKATHLSCSDLIRSNM